MSIGNAAADNKVQKDALATGAQNFALDILSSLDFTEITSLLYPTPWLHLLSATSLWLTKTLYQDAAECRIVRAHREDCSKPGLLSLPKFWLLYFQTPKVRLRWPALERVACFPTCLWSSEVSLTPSSDPIIQSTNSRAISCPRKSARNVWWQKTACLT